MTSPILRVTTGDVAIKNISSNAVRLAFSVSKTLIGEPSTESLTTTASMGGVNVTDTASVGICKITSGTVSVST